MCIEERILL